MKFTLLTVNACTYIVITGKYAYHRKVYIYAMYKSVLKHAVNPVTKI